MIAMGKIIDFNSFRDATGKPRSAALSYEGIQHYRELLDMQLNILDELFHDTEEMLREYHFDPGAFSLLEGSIRGFMATDLQEFYDGGDESIALSYEASIKGVRYRTFACSTLDGDFIQFEYLLLKWDGEEWLLRTDDGWTKGIGPSFFGDE